MMMATTRTSMASRQVNCSETIRSNQFTAAAPRRNAECRMLNAEKAARLSAFCLLHSAFAASRSFDCGEHFQEIRGLANVVHPHHRRSASIRRGNRGERARRAIGAGVASGEMADEFLARRADHDRRDRRQLAASLQQREVVLEILREADAGV